MKGTRGNWAGLGLLTAIVIASLTVVSCGKDEVKSAATTGIIKLTNSVGQDMKSIKIRAAGATTWSQDLLSSATTTIFRNGATAEWSNISTGNKDISFTFADNTQKNYSNGFHVSDIETPNVTASTSGLSVTYTPVASSTTTNTAGYYCSGTFNAGKCSITTCVCNTTNCTTGYYDAGGTKYWFNTNDQNSISNAANSAAQKCSG